MRIGEGVVPEKKVEVGRSLLVAAEEDRLRIVLWFAMKATQSYLVAYYDFALRLYARAEKCLFSLAVQTPCA
jgi:hypothetical protein